MGKWIITAKPLSKLGTLDTSYNKKIRKWGAYLYDCSTNT